MYNFLLDVEEQRMETTQSSRDVLSVCVVMVTAGMCDSVVQPMRGEVTTLYACVCACVHACERMCLCVCVRACVCVF